MQNLHTLFGCRISVAAAAATTYCSAITLVETHASSRGGCCCAKYTAFSEDLHFLQVHAVCASLSRQTQVTVMIVKETVLLVGY